jgi:hypothetical protein
LQFLADVRVGVKREPNIRVSEHFHAHLEATRTVTRLRHGSEPVIKLLGCNPACTAALHDVGKVSPGFQLKYFAESCSARTANAGGV